MSQHGENTVHEGGGIIEEGQVEQAIPLPVPPRTTPPVPTIPLVPQPPPSLLPPVIHFRSSSLDISTTPQHPGPSPASSALDVTTADDQWFREPEVRRHPY